MSKIDSVNSTTITAQVGGSARLLHLDSLRGLAALGVAFFHSTFIFKSIPQADPIGKIFGQAPICFFFLLSGFVLSRSLIKSAGLGGRQIAGYYIRRLFRIYPMVIAGVTFGLIASQFYAQQTEVQSASISLKYLMVAAGNTATTAGYFESLALKNINLDPPLWTIRVELLCSFMLPFLVYLSRKHDVVTITLGVLLAILMTHAQGTCNWANAPTWIFAFYLGFLIQNGSLYLQALSSTVTKWSLGLGVLLLLIFSRGSANFLLMTLILAGVLAVMVPCNWLRLRRLMEASALRFMGRISYSFYILHLPVLLLSWSAVARFFPELLNHHHNFLPACFLFLLSVTMTIPLAALSEYFIERPFNGIGHELSKKVCEVQVGLSQ